jgi:hypothetical protein
MPMIDRAIQQRYRRLHRHFPLLGQQQLPEELLARTRNYFEISLTRKLSHF